MSLKGRGRLSSIDLLPDEARPDVTWAMHELDARERLQKDILQEFNSRLADKGIGPISSSAFNRHSIKLAAISRRLSDTREITQTLTERLEPGDTDNLTIMIAEIIKTLIFEILEAKDASDFTPKQAKELAEALRAATGSQNISTDRRIKAEKLLAKQVEEVTEKLGEKMGLDQETIAKMRRDFLGVKEAA